MGNSGVILETTDNGMTWEFQESSTTGTLYGTDRSSESGAFAVGADGIILRSLPHGNGWEALSSGTTACLRGVCAIDGNVVFVVGDHGTILKSIDGGSEWVPQVSGSDEALLSVSFSDLFQGLAVGAGGTILRTTDGGKRWSREESNTTGILHDVSMTSSGAAIAVGQNGVVLTSNSGNTTSIDPLRWEGAPSGFSLSQNYPNPFNPSTTISFSLITGGRTTLSVFNSLGQKVATLVDGYLGAGEYSYLWDAADLASGVYFYQLRSGTSTTTKRLILSK